MLETEGVDKMDATVLLLIDGIQKPYQQDNAQLSKLMDVVSALVNTSTSAFTIAAVAGTFYEPIENVLRGLSHSCF